MQHAWRLPQDTESVGAARRLVAALAGPEDDDAVQVTSELVANAVEHGWGEIGLVLEDREGIIRIEVSNDAVTDPIPRTPQPLEPSGRGLLIVGCLCAEWGWNRDGDLVTVWADVASTDS